MATYNIDKMRVVRPSAKMSEKHPDRFVTVHGVFHSDKGVLLSITSKVITIDDAKSGDTVIDLLNGILTVADGERGRKENPSLTQDDLLAELEAIRNS